MQVGTLDSSSEIKPRGLFLVVFSFTMEINNWIDHYNQVLQEKSENVGHKGCRIWRFATTGTPHLRYGMLRVRFPNQAKSKPTFVHRLKYILFSRNFNLNRAFHVSHTCHESLCINIEHLSYEPQYVNNNRQNCKNENPPYCKGHGPYKMCIF